MDGLTADLETAIVDASTKLNWIPDVTAVGWGMRFTTQNATLLASNGHAFGTEGFGVPGWSLFRTPGGRYFSVEWTSYSGAELHPKELSGATALYNSATIKHVSFDEAFPDIGDVPDA